MGDFLFNPDLDPEVHNALRRMNRAERRQAGYHTRRYTRPTQSPRRTNRLYEQQRYYQALLAELED